MKKKIIFVTTILAVAGLAFGIYKSGFISKVTKKETGEKIGTLIPKDKKFSTLPVYHIDNAPYYSEKNWCWGSSALMLLMERGLTEEEIQNARAVIKNEGLRTARYVYCLSRIWVGWKCSHRLFKRLYRKICKFLQQSTLS